MKSLFDLQKNYLAADKRYDKKQTKLRKQRDAIEAQLNNMRYANFSSYLEKLGKILLPKIKGAVAFEVMGPFGLGNETSLYFNDKGDFPKNNICGITFKRHGDGYGIKDYSKNLKRYKGGSLGELNGGNFGIIEISPEMDLNWIIKFMKKQK